MSPGSPGVVIVDDPDAQVVVDRPAPNQIIVEDPSPAPPPMPSPGPSGTVIIDDPITEIRVGQSISQVTVQDKSGPEGPPGSPGGPGPPGPPGPTGGYFQYEQQVPSDAWLITHNLPFRPQVTIVDSAGTTIEGGIEYVSDTEILATFTSVFGGTAYLS